METTYSISIYLDTRRAKAKGLFPVKVRLYSPAYSKTKFYPTIFNLSEKDFQSTWETTKPRKEFQELRLEIRSVEKKANDVAKELSVFSFEQFEKKFLGKTGQSEDVFYHYDQMIEALKSNNQFGTASNYLLSKKSLKQYLKAKTGKEPKKLLFIEITKDWLQKYENHMVDTLCRSRTTVSMYLRALRTIFNNAKKSNIINVEAYPFGEDKYEIPNGDAVKKALSNVQLKTLFEASPSTPEQEKAKDFWYFSFACNGMNIKDIALLKWENYKDDKLVFYRAKTIRTTKKKPKLTTVYLTDFALNIIEKYCNETRKPKGLIFKIVSDEMSKAQQYSTIKNFTRFINQNFKTFAISAGLNENISTYWARHSFATNAIRNGASMEFVSEALSHNNIETTQDYFAGFEDESKREFMNKNNEFLNVKQPTK